MLALVADVSAVFGYFGMKRAQEAEVQAQQSRHLAEQARGEAEKLIVYLLDDFYLELEPVGRLDIVAELAKRALNYYKELPPQLRTAETERNRALALVRYGAALRNQSKLDEAGKALAEATGVLEGLRKQGDASEITAIGLGVGLSAQARVADSLNKYAEAEKYAQQAVAVLDPLALAPAPSVPLRRAYGYVMNYVGYSQLRAMKLDDAIKSLEQARATFRSIDSLGMTDLAAATSYAESSGWEMEALRSNKQSEEAKRIGEEGARIAGRVLEMRPAYMGALRARALISSNLSQIEADDRHLAKSIAVGANAIADWDAFLKLDPGNGIAWNNYSSNILGDAYSLYRLGRLDEARDRLHQSVAVEKKIRMSAFFAVNQIFPSWFLAQLEADRGNRAQAEAAVAHVKSLAKIVGEGDASPDARATLRMLEGGARIVIPMADYDFAAARRILVEVIPDASIVPPKGGQMLYIWNSNHANRYRDLALADYYLKDYPAAEKAILQSILYQQRVPERNLDRRRDMANSQVLLAATLARMDRHAEAKKAVAPALEMHRELQTRTGEDLSLRIELAQALAAAGLADGAQGSASFADAAAIIDGLPPSMRNLRSTQLLRKEIAEEQKNRGK